MKFSHLQNSNSTVNNSLHKVQVSEVFPRKEVSRGDSWLWRTLQIRTRSSGNGKSLPLKQTNNNFAKLVWQSYTYSTCGFTVWYWLATAQYNTIYQELCSIVVSLRVIHNWRWLRRFPKMTMKVEFIYLTRLTWLIHTSVLPSKWNLHPKIQFFGLNMMVKRGL